MLGEIFENWSFRLAKNASKSKKKGQGLSRIFIAELKGIQGFSRTVSKFKHIQRLQILCGNHSYT